MREFASHAGDKPEVSDSLGFYLTGKALEKMLTKNKICLIFPPNFFLLI